MAFHSNPAIPVPPRRLSQNSSAKANVDEILKFIHLNPPVKFDLNLKIRFGIITGLMLLIILLYFVRLGQAFFDRDYRIIERNQNGYLNPKVAVLEPTFAILTSTAGMCSLLSMQHDNGGHLSRLTLTSQIFGFVFLFFCGVTRVWKTLSVIPTVPVHVTPFRRNLLTSGLSPSLFNALVVLVYISFPVVTLPLALKVVDLVAKSGPETSELLAHANITVTQYRNAFSGDTIPTTLMEEVMTTLDSKKHLYKKLGMWWRATCVIYLLYCSSLFIVFNYASARLYSTLSTQIQILSQARRRFARMASVGMRSLDNETPFNRLKSAQSFTRYDQVLRSLKNLKESIWAQSQAQSETLQFWDSLESCTENAELERKFKVLMRYRTVVWWQWLCTTLTSLAFLILCIFLVADVLGSYGVPRVKIFIVVQEWAGWAWALPASALACLACCVALMPHSDVMIEPNATRRNSIHKPSAREHRNQADWSRTSMETDVVNLRSYTTFLPETPPSPSKATVLSEFRFHGCKMGRKLHIGKPNPASHEPPKFVIFSLNADEKAEENKLQPEPGCHNGPLGVPHRTDSLQVDLEQIILPPNQAASDVDIIKSLRGCAP